MSKSRIGRPRRVDVPRQPDGDVARRAQPSRANPVVLTETLARRADHVGREAATDQRAGTALGRMHLTGLIDTAQFDAGTRLVGLWQSWSCMACRPRFPIEGRPAPVDSEHPDAELVERWRRLKAEMAAVKAAVLAVPCGVLAWSLIETVVADDMVPPRLDPQHPLFGRWDIGSQALADGLDAVRRIFSGARVNKSA